MDILDFSGSDLEICRFPANEASPRRISMFRTQNTQIRVLIEKEKKSSFRGALWLVIGHNWKAGGIQRRERRTINASARLSSRDD
jgi:hypothetical protein